MWPGIMKTTSQCYLVLTGKAGQADGSREQGLSPQVGGVAAARRCPQSAQHAWQLQMESPVLCVHSVHRCGLGKTLRVRFGCSWLPQKERRPYSRGLFSEVAWLYTFHCADLSAWDLPVYSRAVIGAAQQHSYLVNDFNLCIWNDRFLDVSSSKEPSLTHFLQLWHFYSVIRLPRSPMQP